MRQLMWLLVLPAILARLPEWGSYDSHRLFSLVNTNTSQRIQLGLIHQDSPTILTFESQVLRSSFSFHNGYTYLSKSIQGHHNETIEVTSHIGDTYEANISINSPEPSSVIVLFTGRSNTTEYQQMQGRLQHGALRIETSLKCKLQWSKKETVGIFDSFQETQEEGSTLLLRCQANSGLGYVHLKEGEVDAQDPKDLQEEFSSKVDKFMKFYHLSPIFKDIVWYAVSNTLGSVTSSKSKYSHYLTLESKYPRQTRLQLTPLVIDILSHFDHAIAQQLFDSVVQRLEDQIIYSSKDQLLSMPQHTQIFMKFSNPKSVKVLNSLIYKTLYHKVNHMIGEEAEDYHSSKQLHPILKKMLEITWESEYHYLKSESVYTQSFLDDLYVHSQEEMAGISVSKAAWLLKTVRVLARLNNREQVLSNDQLWSFEESLRNFFKGSCFNKNDKVFKSVNIVGRERYYSSLLSYENFLPIIYQIEPKYEESYPSIFKLLANMTTKHGVVSQAPSKHYDPKANFRGRIWPYYNLKIIQALSTPQDLEDESVVRSLKHHSTRKISEIKRGIEEVLESLNPIEKEQEKLLNSLVRDQVVRDWKTSREMYSSWSPEGEPSKSHPELILINTLFLR